MVSTSSLSSAIAAYRSSILGTTTTTAGQTTTKAGDTTTKASTKAAEKTQAATRTAPATGTAAAKTQQIRQTLDKLQQGIAKDLKAALQKAGVSLTGTVDFSVGANGALKVAGNAKDQANVQAVLSADRSTPSLAARIKSLDQRVELYDSQNTRSAALTTAARQAGKGSNVLDLYQSMMSQNTKASAVFSVSDKSSQLAFSGALNSTA